MRFLAIVIVLVMAAGILGACAKKPAEGPTMPATKPGAGLPIGPQAMPSPTAPSGPAMPTGPATPMGGPGVAKPGAPSPMAPAAPGVPGPSAKPGGAGPSGPMAPAPGKGPG